MRLTIQLFGIYSQQIFYYHLTDGKCGSLKSRQFDRFLSNVGIPGSSCLIIVLWAQKVMTYVSETFRSNPIVTLARVLLCVTCEICISCYSLDRFLLAVIWTSGILSCNRTDDRDIRYVARQIERKKWWMYFAQGMTVSPLN